MASLPDRTQIKTGMKISVELKEDQGTGKLTEGNVKNILTNANSHPYGILVELEDGKMGRVKKLLSQHVSSNLQSTKKAIVHITSKVDVIIPKDEDTWNEFKSTFQYDLAEENLRHDGKIEVADARKNNNKKLRGEIQKETSLTITAFANQEGGRLFIGVNNDSSVLGLGRDLREYSNSIDKFTLAITDSLKKFLQNNAFIAKLKFEFVNYEDKQYLVIQVPKSNEPIFINTSNGQEVYVRIQKSSEKFSHEDFLKHYKEKFSN